MPIHQSQLGRLLYYVLLLATGALALVALGAAFALVTALVAPDMWPGYATVRIDHGPAMALDTMTARVAATLGILGSLALGALVLVPLIGLMRSAAAGTPFVAANVRRLHVIAGAFALYAIVRVIVPLVVTPAVATMLQLEGPTFDMGPILMALIVLVLAEIFRQGVALREDVEGTV